ncbi:MAG: leucine-rich repeat domain-containing protein [Promethearchaeota archaeon]
MKIQKKTRFFKIILIISLLGILLFTVINIAYALNDLNEGLVLHYEFDDNAKDSSGFGYDGELHGVEVKYGEAYFDGKNDYISGRLLNFTSSLSICIILTPNFTGFNYSFFIMNEPTQLIMNNNSNNQIGIGIGLDCIYIRVDNSKKDIFFSPEALNEYDLNFIAIIFELNYEGLDISVYFNNEFLDTINYYYYDKIISFEEFVIGKEVENHCYYKGSISDIRIYDRALSEKEIYAIWNLFTGYYSFINRDITLKLIFAILILIGITSILKVVNSRKILNYEKFFTLYFPYFLITLFVFLMFGSLNIILFSIINIIPFSFFIIPLMSKSKEHFEKFYWDIEDEKDEKIQQFRKAKGLKKLRAFMGLFIPGKKGIKFAIITLIIITIFLPVSLFILISLFLLFFFKDSQNPIIEFLINFFNLQYLILIIFIPGIFIIKLYSGYFSLESLRNSIKDKKRPKIFFCIFTIILNVVPYNLFLNGSAEQNSSIFSICFILIKIIFIFLIWISVLLKSNFIKLFDIDPTEGIEENEGLFALFSILLYIFTFITLSNLWIKILEQTYDYIYFGSFYYFAEIIISLIFIYGIVCNSTFSKKESAISEKSRRKLKSIKLDKEKEALIEIQKSIDIGLIKLKKIKDNVKAYFIVKDGHVNILKISYVDLLKLSPYIGALEKLETLDLSGNLLKELPLTFKNLKSLKFLDLSGNNFKTFPNIITDLQSLQVLKFNYNYIEFIPNSIGRLKTLQHLNLSHNKLEDLPESIGELNSLITLDLSFNLLKKFPDFIFKLKSIKKVNLKNNKIDKFSIPISIINKIEINKEPFNPLIFKTNLFLFLNKNQNINSITISFDDFEKYVCKLPQGAIKSAKKWKKKYLDPDWEVKINKKDEKLIFKRIIQ